MQYVRAGHISSISPYTGRKAASCEVIKPVFVTPSCRPLLVAPCNLKGKFVKRVQLKTLLDQVDPAAESIVENTRKTCLKVLRDGLISETRLQLSQPDTLEMPNEEYGHPRKPREDEPEKTGDVRRIQFITKEAYPVGFDRIEIGVGDGFDWELTIAAWRPALLSLADMSERVHGMLADEFRKVHPGANELLKDRDLYLPIVATMARELAGGSSVGGVIRAILRCVDGDVLGCYQWKPAVRSPDNALGTPTITLYWAVIAFISKGLGVSIEGLTSVVLAHELAHAYTHAGADANGQRWETVNFKNSESHLVEGLAQYYANRVLRNCWKRLPKDCIDSFDRLLEHQTEPYRSFLPWIDAQYAAEDMRQALIKTRVRGKGTLVLFTEALRDARLNNRH